MKGGPRHCGPDNGPCSAASLSYAVDEGYRPDNPVSGIVRPKDQTREWRLDDAGYRGWANA